MDLGLLLWLNELLLGRTIKESIQNLKYKDKTSIWCRRLKDTVFYLHGAATDKLIGSTGKIPGGPIWFFGPWEPVFTRGTGLKFIMHALPGLTAPTQRSLADDAIMF